MLPCSLGGKSQEEDTPSHPRFAMARDPSALGIVIFVLIADARVCFVLSVQNEAYQRAASSAVGLRTCVSVSRWPPTGLAAWRVSCSGLMRAGKCP